MPRHAEWFQRVPAIVAVLEELPADSLDRRMIQELFAVSARRALQLMGRFGAKPMGGALIVGRQALLEALRAVQQDPAWCFEQRRRGNLERRLLELNQLRRAQQVQLRLPQPGAATTWHELEPWAEFGPQCLSVRYETALQLLERLYLIAKAAVDDLEGFERRATAINREAAGQ